ncbi:TPA: restriction endonuclease subunit S [Streptococcus suis]|nr:restriction endonuclease subunit S [Streptococcus suis]
MKTNNNIPVYRFQSYTDAWELRKLNNIADVRDGTHNSPQYIEFGYPLVTSKNIKNGQVNFEDIQYISSFDYEEINKRSKVNINDILMGMIGTVGNLALVREEPEFAIKNVALIKNIGVVNVEFLYHYLGSYVIEKQLLNSIDGGTQKFISLNKIRHLDITFPTLPEQKAIGTFFSTLDRHITLHQRKLDTLKEQKKTYLKLLFPAKGQTKPALRFQGFEDDWELRKLGEISTHRGGTAIEKHFSEDGKYKVISIGSYGLDNKYIDQKIRAVENEVTRSKVVNKNELTMVLNDKTANGNIIGRCLLIEADDEFVINQRTEIISFNSVIYPKFAYVVLNGVFREQVKKIVQGGTQIYVNYTSVEQLYLSLPSLPEQEAIGTFFQTLDQEIAQVEDKLASLKEMKKTLLRKLFV